MLHSRLCSIAFGLIVLGATHVRADQIFATSYDMLNGGSGSYTYHDNTYNGSGNPNVDYSPLSGGLGMLTDGVIATQNWYVTPNLYVGWATYGDNDPGIVFHFAGTENFSSVSLSLDNSGGAGGVSPPSSVTIGGTNFAVTPPSGTAPFTESFDVTGLSGNTLTIQLFQRNEWIMLSEVQFFGASSVPEPSTFVLISTTIPVGFGVYWNRRKRARGTA
jgi:hypothetical protein